MGPREHKVKRRLAAIFAADVAAYSRLMSQDEVGTLQTLTAHREIMDQKIAEYGGRIANTAGDSILAEFPSAVDAVQCAVEVQRALANLNSDVGPDRALRFRIGIHVGDVVVRGGDLLGDGVNIASRLEGLAEPGGVCISDDAYRHVRKVLVLSYADMRPNRVKNIEEPVHAFAVTIPTPVQAKAASGPSIERSLALRSNPAIAVLPFTNMSDDPEQQYFVSGLRDDIVTALLRFSGITVLSSSSHLTSHNQASPPVALPNTAYLLMGSVRKSGNRARVTAQLTNPSGEGLWADKYDFNLDDVFAVQDELARSIPAALKVKLEEHERHRTLMKPPTNLDAYDYYLRGRHLERSFDRSQRAHARSMFLAATKADPHYSRGYLGLAWFEIRTLKWSEPSDRDEVLTRALDAALTATTLDPTDAECHWALGVIYLWKRDYDRSIASYEKARALTPSHADLLADMADAMTYVGRPEEAIEIGQTALRLNPDRPDWYLWNVAAGYYLSGDYVKALNYLQQMAQYGPAYRLLAATYAQLGQAQEAKEAAGKLLRFNPGFSIHHFAAQAPYMREGDLTRYVDGLRLAGLPE